MYSIWIWIFITIFYEFILVNKKSSISIDSMSNEEDGVWTLDAYAPMKYRSLDKGVRWCSNWMFGSLLDGAWFAHDERRDEREMRRREREGREDEGDKYIHFYSWERRYSVHVLPSGHVRTHVHVHGWYRWSLLAWSTFAAVHCLPPTSHVIIAHLADYHHLAHTPLLSWHNSTFTGTTCRHTARQKESTGTLMIYCTLWIRQWWW